MTRLLALALAATLGLAAVGGHARAEFVTSINTGVDGGGGLLAPGSLDGRYQLVSSADPAVPGPDLFVIAPVGGPNAFPFGYWFANGPDSQWIVPYANGVTSVATASPQGDYVYRMTFDLTGFDPSTARIDGSWATDERGTDILINGASTGLTTAGGLGFLAFTPFAITTGFVTGLNTLDFVAFNIDQATGNPVGFRADGAVTASVAPAGAVPEPASLALLGVGAAGLVGRRLRRRA